LQDTLLITDLNEYTNLRIYKCYYAEAWRAEPSEANSSRWVLRLRSG